MKNTYCGVITLIGRTNVGKSTLFNKLINNKISITSHKINTTQKKIIGIITKNVYQYIFIDSPGLFKKKKNILNKKIINFMIQKSDFILLIITALQWTNLEKKLLQWIKNSKVPYVLIINKIDLIQKKNFLLPFLKNISKHFKKIEIMLLSAKKDIQFKKLMSLIQKKIPQKKHKYLSHEKTNCTKKFLSSEIIRKTLLKFFHQEIPYMIKIYIPIFFINSKNEYIIESILQIPHLRYKKILIGKKGEKIKNFCIKSQKNIEKLFKKKTHLKLKIILKKNI
ncbi:GTPase Era [Buchnera aphidicola]|uniref:GTPase Era n=1 Tax=Buchnera aphidicola subsp. Tuberolachnus salignus TaxID=98804 RepID=A0A160SWZ0_BUCTT|nr:GTPase Era [Buchnera aphidicola]CUR53148.1 GTPase Era [Buchnera aphidicola (Tuberolachnus salignus)]